MIEDIKEKSQTTMTKQQKDKMESFLYFYNAGKARYNAFIK